MTEEQRSASPPSFWARIGLGTLAAMLLTSGVYDLGAARAGDGLVQLALGAFFAFEAFPRRDPVPISRGLMTGLVAAAIVMLVLRFTVRSLSG